MANKRKHSHRPNQMLRYLSGELSDAEQYALERELLNDGFAQEALEGMEQLPVDELQTKLKELSTQLTATSGKRKSLQMGKANWLRYAASVAAMLIISGGAYWYLYQDLNQAQPPLAEAVIEQTKHRETSKQVLPPSPTIVDKLTDSPLPVQPSLPNVVPELKPSPSSPQKKAWPVLPELAILDDDIALDADIVEEQTERKPIDKTIPDTTTGNMHWFSPDDELVETEIAEVATVAAVPKEALSQGWQGGKRAGKESESFAGGTLAEQTDQSLQGAGLAADVGANKVLAANGQAELQQKKKELAREARKARRLVSARADKATNQPITIKGIVHAHSSNTPLPGCNVLINGTQQGTVTDIEGHFSLLVRSDEPVNLAFSFMGFEEQEHTVLNDTVLNIALDSDAMALNDVVVVGYGAIRKDSVAGVVAAQPIGGMRAYRKYLKNAAKRFAAQQGDGLAGTVKLRCVIDRSGMLQNITMKKELSPLLDSCAVNIVKAGPHWYPQTVDGKPVDSRVTIRVHFP